MDERPMGYVDRDAIELLKLKRKYTGQLERYNRFLGILVRLANTNELQTVRREIFQFLEENTI